jgi:hypothetical protein
MKRVLEFELNGQPVYIEVDESETDGLSTVSRGANEIIRAEEKFSQAVNRIRPAAEALLNSFREMVTPEEIGLEFGVKFNAKAGAILASIDSEATFKVSLKWKNVKA